jgi:hypothetical protein
MVRDFCQMPGKGATLRELCPPGKYSDPRP